MKRIAVFLCAFIPLLAASALAADEGIRTCALTRAFECSSDAGCTEWSIREMALPRFFQVDLNAKTITSLDKEVPRAPTIITAIDHPEGMLVLHGAEKRGWSMAIGEQSGYLTLSVAADDGGFVVFGSCISP
ncbi:MAG: hypothetical protein P8Z70_02855 [Desulfuromonadales bacterium]|jgi:hypothetical protein